ncbi:MULTISPECIES: hypothetical protein [unclassified Streptomyces]|uniref:hypothetical protein n=1 Tax=unclassified Streptomyces TaxID=2593676 RepID=UPI002E2CC24A|nr:hypothetical protein [Streptomyces sp. NBC_00223]
MASPATSVRAGTGMRLLRAAVFTAVCVVLAAAGHTMASGGTVSGASLVVGWLAVFAVVAPLAGRERTLPGIAALLAAGQLALHTVFNVGQMCATLTAAPAGPDADHGLMATAARLVCGEGQAGRLSPQAAREIVARAGLGPSAIGSPMHMPGMRMPGDPGFGVPAPVGGHEALALSLCTLPMLLGHLLAAVIAGWLLRRGEAALWRLIRLSVRGAAGLTALTPALLLRRAYAAALLAALAAGAPYVRLRVRCATPEAAARHRTVWLRHCLARRGPPVVVLAA